MCAEPLIGSERSAKAIALIGGLGTNDRLAPLMALIARLTEAVKLITASIRRRRHCSGTTR
jgi:hypothetical protein